MRRLALNWIFSAIGTASPSAFASRRRTAAPSDCRLRRKSNSRARRTSRRCPPPDQMRPSSQIEGHELRWWPCWQLSGNRQRLPGEEERIRCIDCAIFGGRQHRRRAARRPGPRASPRTRSEKNTMTSFAPRLRLRVLLPPDRGLDRATGCRNFLELAVCEKAGTSRPETRTDTSRSRCRPNLRGEPGERPHPELQRSALVPRRVGERHAVGDNSIDALSLSRLGGGRKHDARSKGRRRRRLIAASIPKSPRRRQRRRRGRRHRQDGAHAASERRQPSRSPTSSSIVHRRSTSTRARDRSRLPARPLPWRARLLITRSSAGGAVGTGNRNRPRIRTSESPRSRWPVSSTGNARCPVNIS